MFSLSKKEQDHCSSLLCLYCDVQSPVYSITSNKLCIVALFLKDEKRIKKSCQTIAGSFNGERSQLLYELMCHCCMQYPWCLWDSTSGQKLHWIHQFVTILKILTIHAVYCIKSHNDTCISSQWSMCTILRHSFITNNPFWHCNPDVSV